ncbi:MAG TPA: extracellular solute-binding protein [Alphaproteobacteria bacterium]|jgi:ABC-type Fe3+ transport system substrate-binding protein
MSKRSKWFIGAVLGGLLAAAPAVAQDWQAGAGEDWKQLLAAAKAEGKVVVAGSPDLAKPMSQGFTRDTGITVEFLGANARDLSSRVSREVKTGNVTLDLMLGGASDLDLVKGGYAVPIKPQFILPGVTDGKNWADGKIKWVDTAQEYMFQGAEYVNAQPFFNIRVLKPDQIKNWKDFLKPEFKGKIASVDPRVAGSGQAAAAYLAYLFGSDFVKQLYVDQQVMLSRDSRQVVEWGERGVYPIVIGGSPTDYETFKANGVDNLIIGDMEDGPGTTVGGFSIIWQPKGNPHPKATQVFLNWYASKPGQEAYIAGKGTPSRRTDIDVSKLGDYLMVKPGKVYLDGYAEEFYYNARPKLAKEIIDALGGM